MKPAVINQYQIIRNIRREGGGGGAVVYFATDTRLLRPVVLKMLRRGRSDEATREVMLREARLASAIDHPNVCSIYEVSETADGQVFIAMQYVPGRTVAELLEAGPLSVQLALSIAIQAADGMAAAHRLGIVHRDLKPANLMLTDVGLLKILDFGMAKRKEVEKDLPLSGSVSKPARARRSSSSSHGGTMAYMAPEQFMVGGGTEQTDLFALGVILYEMLLGSHPFLPVAAVTGLMDPQLAQARISRSIQFAEPTPLPAMRPEISHELDKLVMTALAKNPVERFQSAAELREALKMVMKSLRLESGLVPGEIAALLPASGTGPEKRSGVFSLLTERFMRNNDADPQQDSVAVLPFRNLQADDPTPFYGFALAEAVSTRLAQLPGVTVRSPLPVLRSSAHASDPIDTGKNLGVSYVLTATYMRTEGAFSLTWQLLHIAENAVRSGGTLNVGSLDLMAVQNQISEQVSASLRGTGPFVRRSAAMPRQDISGTVAEDYLQARARLSRFIFQSSRREDLDEARNLFSHVLSHAPDYAPAHSGLGIAHLQYVRSGLGGMSHLMAAQKSFERALDHEPTLIEAQVHRVYALLIRGEKESARHGVMRLLQAAASDFDVHVVAGIIFRLDGMYAESMEQFNTALQLNPANALPIYNHRARIYQYQGQLELARQEIQKGLTLDPKHPLLRTSLGYQSLREGDLAGAINCLESVLASDSSVRIACPTLAMCYVAAGQPERAEPLLGDEVLSAATADAEMAYRLATYFAMSGDANEALHWLRRAIYMGNENYPWFNANPAWEKLRENEDLGSILKNLKKSYRRNQENWKRLRSGT